jgi:3-oxoadipate enol-lactonase
MATCEVNGTQLYYQQSGNGSPALFVHGMCGNANVWDGQVARLSDRFRCITYDRRGHTRSPLGTIAARSVALHADDAAELIGKLELAPCLLVASSGGARIGVDLLRRYPVLFSAAVLSEPPIFALDPEQGAPQVMADLKPRLEAAFARNDPRAAVDAFFEYICPGLWAKLDERQKEPYRANHPELLGDLQMPPYEMTPAELGRLGTRCAIVSGSRSHPLFRRVAAVIAGAVPNAEAVEIEGVGHVTYAEAPDEFARIVRQSLAPAA